MSFQVSARRWRPQSFDEVSAQSHVTIPLRNAIATGRVPHAVLLTGPRGVGKTTCARILARCLNCDDGPTDTPCGTCASCVEISEGRSTDVQEVDAASRTSVEDVRGLIESIRYAPRPGKHRIFVVDEVHMLSNAAFNALLKTLEEPPPSSLFVFATTNPEKIPFTVLSRCQRYDLRRISTKEIAARLSTIADADGVTISPSSLLAIAREGDGSMRDAQTLFDQVVAHCSTADGVAAGRIDVRDEVVREVLDLIDRRVLLDVLEACIGHDAAGALAACARATAGSSDPKRVSELLVGLLRDLVVLRVAPDAPGLVEGSDEEIADLRSLAASSEPARLRRMFRALVKEQEDLAWAPDPLAVLEMAVVRLATMADGDDVAQLLSRLEALEARLAGGGAAPAPGGAGGGRPMRAAPSRAGAERAPDAPGRRAAPPATASTDTPASPPSSTPASTSAAAADSARPAPPVDADPRPVPPPAPRAPGVGAPLDVVFDRLRAVVREQSPGVYAILNGMRMTSRDPGRIALRAPSAFSKERLADRLADFEALCARFFGEPTRVAVEYPQEHAAQADPPSREDARRLRHEALNHPIVNTALEVLQAEIVEIRPLASGGSPRPPGPGAEP